MAGSKTDDPGNFLRIQVRFYEHRDAAVYEFLNGMSSTSANRLVAYLLETHVRLLTEGPSPVVSKPERTARAARKPSNTAPPVQAALPSVASLEPDLAPVVQLPEPVAPAGATNLGSSKLERWSRAVHLSVPV